jgi:hypothetical protein
VRLFLLEGEGPVNGEARFRLLPNSLHVAEGYKDELGYSAENEKQLQR